MAYHINKYFYWTKQNIDLSSFVIVGDLPEQGRPSGKAVQVFPIQVTGTLVGRQ